MNRSTPARHSILGKLRSLSPGDYAMVLTAMVLLPLVNVGLHTAGFQRTRGFVCRLSPGTTVAGADLDARIQRAARCVSIAARRGPYRATCLRESLVLWWFLRWLRAGPALVIGVQKGEEGFASHAWISVDGVAVGGRRSMAGRYLPMLVDAGKA